MASLFATCLLVVANSRYLDQNPILNLHMGLTTLRKLETGFQPQNVWEPVEQGWLYNVLA